MKLELYLDGNLVDINQDIDFVLNKKYTELSDLTSIIVDYSKTIRIPMTPRNNELFNYVFKLDHQVLLGQDIINYDPSQKIPMSMVYNGSIVMDGYALLNKADVSARVYEVGVYSQLGKIFSILKEKTLANYNNPSSPLGHEVTMNTRTISTSFYYDHHKVGIPDVRCDWYDAFGFAPQLVGKTGDLDTTCYHEYSSGGIKYFADEINRTRNIDYGDVYVGDGLDMNAYCELRSYMCRPYVYVDKLITLVQGEVNENPDKYDGYKMLLDGGWFTQSNPYFNNLVYFPGNESMVDSGEGKDGYVDWGMGQPVIDHTITSYLPIVQDSSLTITGPEATLTLDCSWMGLRTYVTDCDDESGWNKKGVWAYYRTGSDDICVADIPYVAVLDGSGNLLAKMYMCDDTICLVQESGWTYWSKLKFTGVWSRLKSLGPKVFVPTSCGTYQYYHDDNHACELTQYFNFGRIALNSNSFQFRFGCDKIDLDRMRVVAEDTGFSDKSFLHPFKNDKYKNKTWNSGSVFSAQWGMPRAVNISGNTYRSMSILSGYDILGADFNPFKWLINYVKMFRLYFDVDYSAKTITLRDNYFSNVTYKNVTVDYSKPVVIEPIVDKYNKVRFDYKDNGSKKGVQYLRNYGVDYGDMVIDTGIEVNSDVLSLNPDKELGVFIPTRIDCLTWSTLNSLQTLRPRNPLFTSKVINTLNKKNEIEYFPFFAFRWDNVYNPLQHNVPFYCVTDDTPMMRSTGKYCYLDHTQGWASEVETTEDGQNVYYLLNLSYMPQFDNYLVVRNNNTTIYWDTFGIPAEVYNLYVPQSDEQVCVYDRWRRYLDEIFNVNNKKVTCYVRMSYPEFINFKFNQLFVIDNNVFLVNKIIDFNPNSTEPTKVELIQISDVGSLS